LKEAIMTEGNKEDWAETEEQLKNPNPTKDGRTWLRHYAHRQSGLIDEMVLRGDLTVEQMAQDIRRKFGPEKPLKYWVRRVNDHIEHLQEGDRRGRIDGREPHRLKVKTDSFGNVTFDLG